MITFVVPVYKKPFAVMQMASCLILQESDAWKCIFVVDYHDEDFYQKEIEEVESYLKSSKYADKFRFIYASERLGEYGHRCRELGLHLVNTKYVCLTGHDNYYAPNFVDRSLSYFTGGTSMVYCVGLNNCNNYHMPIGYFESGQIDMGQVVVETAIAKEIGFAYTEYTGDFLFFKDIINKYKNLNQKKINSILYVHN